MNRTAILLALLGALPSVTTAQVTGGAIPRGKVPSQPYAAFDVIDAFGRTITGYLSEARGTAPRPLIVYVHGSGHQSHFQQAGGRVVPANGHATLVDVVGDRARVLIVEKPGVQRYERGDEPASRMFREEHTLGRWVEAVVAATRAARRLPGIDTTRLLVVGHSEGGLVAARVAARLPEVSHVALLAGGGPTQLFDLIQLARAGTFFSDVSAEPAAREAYVVSQWEAIRADPESATRDFFGHPFRRWSSFLADSPIAALAHTPAKVFLAQGERDQAVSRASFDALAAQLTAAGRAPAVHLMAGADHSFALAGAAPRDGWAEILGDLVRWYLG
jgi:predicted esterase